MPYRWWLDLDETPHKPPVFYRIDDLVIDTGSRRVSRGRKVLKVRGLTYDFLVALVDAAPGMLSYDALGERVWQGRPVAPETIAQRAKMLRDALSDDARSPRYVELIRGQGYRLLGDVETVGRQQRPPGFARRMPWVAATGLVLAAVVLAVMVRTPRGIPSVAVLPFADMSPMSDQQYLADGIAEELINHLADLDGLEVASRTESFAYPNESRDLKRIGRDLSVSAILEGSVRKSEDDIRVTVQLIDVDSGYHLWTQNFDEELDDIFEVQDEIAASVAGALGVQLGVGAINQFTGAGTRNFAAYEAFLKNDYAEAIRLDPGYAAAWAAAGLRIASTMWLHMPREAPAILERAYEHTETALRLDPLSARAHADFATMNYASMDWIRSEEAFAEALSLRRDEYALQHYANMMMRTGRTSRAQRLHEERDALMPDSYTQHPLRIRVDLARNDLDAARARLPRLYPDSRSYMALFIALNSGSVTELQAAIDALPANLNAYQELFEPVRDLLNSPDRALPFLRRLLHDPARQWPSKYQGIALLAAFLGAPEMALEALLQDIPYTAVRFGTLWYPVMSDVRQMDAFKTVVTDVNLVDYWREYGWSDFCRPVGEDDFACR